MRKTKPRAKSVTKGRVPASFASADRMRTYVSDGLGVPKDALPGVEAAVASLAVECRTLRGQLLKLQNAPAPTHLSPDYADYIFDTEFIEDGETIDLISIGMVSLDGREYYACNQDARLNRASEWVRENVLPHLPKYGDPVWKPHAEIGIDIEIFTEKDARRPRFWAYYADYDWVAFCQLYGTMMQLPDRFPKLCLDLKQYALMAGVDSLPAQEGTEHDALEDARWGRVVFEYLKGLT